MSGKQNGTTDPDNPFAEWLIQQVDKRGITMSAFAEYIGVGNGTISKIVNRKNNLSVSLAKRIARGLGLPQSVVYAVSLLQDDGSDGEAETLEFYYRELADVVNTVEDHDKRQALKAKLLLHARIDAGAESGNPLRVVTQKTKRRTK